MDDLLVLAGAQLTELVLKSTASTVSSKIAKLKTESNNDKLRAQYDSLINELILEREEAVRLATIYKNEVDRIQISDEDIEHLQNTIQSVLELIFKFDKTHSISKEILEPIKSIISKDTLKAMQLLGFNYKEAIGEPLTMASANYIESKLNYRQKRQNKK